MSQVQTDLAKAETRWQDAQAQRAQEQVERRTDQQRHLNVVKEKDEQLAVLMDQVQQATQQIEEYQRQLIQENHACGNYKFLVMGIIRSGDNDLRLWAPCGCRHRE